MQSSLISIRQTTRYRALTDIGGSRIPWDWEGADHGERAENGGLGRRGAEPWCGSASETQLSETDYVTERFFVNFSYKRGQKLIRP